MKTLSHLCAAGLCAAACACTHTPPGTSVEIALAKKAQLIRLPDPAPLPEGARVAKTGGSSIPVPAVEPELPILGDRIEAEAEAFTRGKFAMADGHDEEAIRAFEETVELDPTHQEAWQNLAILYEKTGSEKKAVAAFRKSKSLAGR